MRIYYDNKYGTMKMVEGGKATLVERIEGKNPADSNHDVDHFEIWKQGGKHYLFCFEVGPAYYGIQVDEEKLEKVRNLSVDDLKGLALNAICI